MLWDNADAPRLYSVEVTADAPGLERYLRQLLPDEQIDVTASGNSVTLSGQVRDASSANRAVEIAKGSGATIVDNLATPEAVQVLLQVRFAEVNRSADQAVQLADHHPEPSQAEQQRRLERVAQRDPLDGAFRGLSTSGSSTPTPASRR